MFSFLDGLLISWRAKSMLSVIICCWSTRKCLGGCWCEAKGDLMAFTHIGHATPGCVCFVVLAEPCNGPELCASYSHFSHLQNTHGVSYGRVWRRWSQTCQSSGRIRGSGHKLKNSRFLLNPRRKTVLPWVWLSPGRGCPGKVCSTHPADGQNAAEQCLGHISVADPAWGGRLDQMVSSGPFQPQLFCDSELYRLSWKHILLYLQVV